MLSSEIKFLSTFLHFLIVVTVKTNEMVNNFSRNKFDENLLNVYMITIDYGNMIWSLFSTVYLKTIVGITLNLNLIICHLTSSSLLFSMIAQLNLVSTFQEGNDSCGNGNGDGNGYDKAQSSMFSACVHVTGYSQNSSESGSQRGGGGARSVLDIDSCIESPLRTGIDSEEERERKRGREREREREEDRRNNKADRNKSTPSPPTLRHPINNNSITSHPQHLYPVKQGRPNVEGSVARLAAHGHRALVFVCGPASMVQQAAALSMKYETDFRHETFEL